LVSIGTVRLNRHERGYRKNRPDDARSVSVNFPFERTAAVFMDSNADRQSNASPDPAPPNSAAEGCVDGAVAWPKDWPNVLLVGGGIVGRAIAELHLRRDIPFVLADQSGEMIDTLLRDWTDQKLPARPIALAGLEMRALQVGQVTTAENRCPLVIESIAESLPAKRQLFQTLQQQFGNDITLCSNTSTFRIESIADESLTAPEQVVGLHFFMPVHARAAVEVVAGPCSSDAAIKAATDHGQRLGKRPILCGDGPGFIVNRMLAPYLNQALLLLCRGATADQLDRVARAYGMPMSPLELIDWIGTPTTFHAGRAFWQAYPNRLDPSPMVAALVKRKRWGRSVGQGLYDYVDGMRSQDLAPETQELVERYRMGSEPFADADVLKLLTIPMWIESTCLLEEGVADSVATVNLAMAGGLGFQPGAAWSDFFSELGEEAIWKAIERWQGDFRSMRPPKPH
jgi:3-hydroxyacyl-CoA dehydrogenase